MIKKLPFIIALITMLGGVFIAILFGANEDFFKKKISDGLKNNKKIASIIDSRKRDVIIEKEKKKCWRYYQRYHFHSAGIGAMVLSLLIFLSFISAPEKLIDISKYLLSIGGFLYPHVWLFAAIYGPEMGRAQAKETFAIFGFMGGLFLLGLLLSLYLAIRYSIDVIKK